MKPWAIILLDEARESAINTVMQNHYLRSVPSGKCHYIRYDGALVVWSIPANKNIAGFLKRQCVWELARLWAPDGHEHNLLTQAISAATKVLQKLEPVDALVSYADPNVGHSGGVYRAAGWTQHGVSEETRVYEDAEGRRFARRSFHSGKIQLSKREIEQRGFKQLKLPGKIRFVRFL